MHELTPTEFAVLTIYRRLRDKATELFHLVRDIRNTVAPVAAVVPAPTETPQS